MFIRIGRSILGGVCVAEPTQGGIDSGLKKIEDDFDSAVRSLEKEGRKVCINRCDRYETDVESYRPHLQNG